MGLAKLVQPEDQHAQLVLEDGRTLPFQRQGRSPAERLFALEEEQLLKAQAQEECIVEMIFFPFYRPLGHTGIRIGRAVYELSRRKGWVAHNQGLDNARGFIFNNPYFKSQLRKFPDLPPYSIGLSYRLEKTQIDQLRQHFEQLATAKGKNKFSFLLNNCNQALLRILSKTDLNFHSGSATHLSCVLTFQKLLRDYNSREVPINIYPVAGSECNEAEITAKFPRELKGSQTLLGEVQRCLTHFLTRK